MLRLVDIAISNLHSLLQSLLMNAVTSHCRDSGAAYLTVQVPRGVTRVMTLALATLSLKGGAAQGAALLQGLLVTGPASYYAAALQLAITGEEEEGRQAAITTLLQVPVDSLPLPVLLDSMLQVQASVYCLMPVFCLNM